MSRIWGIYIFLCVYIYIICTIENQLRFRTDANLPGVEKVAVCSPNKAFLEAPYKPMAPLDPSYSENLRRHVNVSRIILFPILLDTSMYAL